MQRDWKVQVMSLQNLLRSLALARSSRVELAARDGIVAVLTFTSATWVAGSRRAEVLHSHARADAKLPVKLFIRKSFKDCALVSAASNLISR